MPVSCHTEALAQKVLSQSRTRQGLYVSWKWLRRADSIAEALGFPSYTVKYMRTGMPLPLVLVKYALQSASTFFLLLRRRPRVVFITNPPIVAVAPVYLYSLLFRARYVIDTHSGCFTLSHWKKVSGVQRFFSRRAAFTLVHNADNARILDTWGVAYEVFPSLPPVLSLRSQPRAAARPLIVFICSHNADEPLEEFLGAAERLPECDFFITGKASPEVEEKHPENVTLPGFLSEDDYLDLLVRADLLVALTTEDGTLLYGAQEAIALHKPLVVSDTSTLRSYFPEGTVFTRNSAEGIAQAIATALEHRGELTEAMTAFEHEYRAQGEERLRRVRERLGLAPEK